MSAPTRWLVYACRTDFTADVVAIIARRGDEVGALVDNLGDGAETSDSSLPLGVTVVRPEGLTGELRGLAAVIPLITPGHRHQVVAEARSLGLGDFPPLVDPTAVLAPSTAIGEGAVVNAAAVFGGEVSVGRFVHVNRSASVGHHSVLHDFSTLGPGCVLAGRVEVRPGAFVGAGAVCAPKVCIGENAIVGAGAVVVRDVPPGAVVVGNPATVIRQGAPGYGGASVSL